MTQSQSKLTFYSCSSISAWAGKENGIHYLEGLPGMPYIEKAGAYYYFGFDGLENAYHLIMVSSKDIQGD